MPSFSFNRILPCTPELAFDVAADVEAYPSYLPGWIVADVVGRKGNIYQTDQIVGFGPVRRQFRTVTKLRRPTMIEVDAIDGPFDRFHLDWTFEPQAHRRCQIFLSGTVELRTMYLRGVFEQALVGGMAGVLRAFEDRVVALADAKTIQATDCR